MRKRADAKHRIYCSMTCRQHAMWQKSGRLREKRKCPTCGKMFAPNVPTSTFCSKLCVGPTRSVRMSGPLNNRYVHGQARKPYPKGWTTTYRESIRKRDGYTCRVCRMVQADSGVKLAVHHIDYVKENILPEN